MGLRLWYALCGAHAPLVVSWRLPARAARPGGRVGCRFRIRMNPGGGEGGRSHGACSGVLCKSRAERASWGRCGGCLGEAQLKRRGNRQTRNIITEDSHLSQRHREPLSSSLSSAISYIAVIVHPHQQHHHNHNTSSSSSLPS